MLRPGRSDDCAALSRLALRSKAVWGYSSEFLAQCARELTVTAEHLPHAFVIERDAQPVAFYALSQTAQQGAELEFLFVDPLHLRQGHGRALLAHARRHARQVLGARLIVIQGDPHADPFYRAAGARLVGERESDSVPGRMLPLYELACGRGRGLS
jgi:GNAT superfamily N-acetyltransferase